MGNAGDLLTPREINSRKRKTQHPESTQYMIESVQISATGKSVKNQETPESQEKFKMKNKKRSHFLISNLPGHSPEKPHGRLGTCGLGDRQVREDPGCTIGGFLSFSWGAGVEPTALS